MGGATTHWNLQHTAHRIQHTALSEEETPTLQSFPVLLCLGLQVLDCDSGSLNISPQGTNETNTRKPEKTDMTRKLEMIEMTRKFEVADMTKKLPVEVLERIFQSLSPRELRMAVLVCRRWREVGETPALWSSLPVRVNTRNLSVMPEILSSRRLQAVRKFVIRTHVSQEFLLSLLERPEVMELAISSFLWSSNLTNNDRSCVDRGLLSRQVTRLETSDVRYTPLTTQQTEAALNLMNVIKAAAVGGCTVTLM